MMRKVNSYKLLLVFITGLFACAQSAGANDTNTEPSNSAHTVKPQSTLQAYEVSGGDDDDDDVYKPETVVAGQYSVSDNFSTLGKPADIGC